MLQNKDITKIQEIKTLFQVSWTQPEFLAYSLFDALEKNMIFVSWQK